MKKILYACIFLITGIMQQAFTQSIGNLDGIYYQAVAIDNEGKEIVGMDIENKPLYDKTIGVRFSITKELNGEILWEETHTTNTDKFGLFNLIIGKGELTSNSTFSNLLDIPWIDADQYLKVEISINNDGNYKLVSNQQFMAVPYSFYTDDIADDAITTSKILNSTIINEDIANNAISSSKILDKTIINEDIDDDAITSSKILNSTIINEDIDDNAITTIKILNSTIINEDVANDAITSSKILNNTIINEDIADNAVTSRNIDNNSIVNDDIANNTINLSTKVTDTLAVVNGGTGKNSLEENSLLIGNGSNPIKTKVLACVDSSILISQTNDTILLSALFKPTEITSDPAGTFNIGNLPAGSTYTSNAINSFECNLGDIVIGSVNVNLQGCMMTCYVSQPNVIRVSIYNSTGSAVNLGTVDIKVYVVR